MSGRELPPELSARLAALTPAQRALLGRALQQKGQAEQPSAQPPAPPPAAQPATPSRRVVPRDRRADFYPLSVDQERLWFVQQLDLESPIYNIYSARRVRGPLSVPHLTGALNESVRRHEILRTAFPALDGKPVQRIAPRLEASIPLVDLRSLPAARREAEVARIAAETVRAPFRIDRLPLFRTLLIQVDAEELVWPIVIHHLVTDWISYYALEGELTAIYAAFLAGRPSPLPEPALQFADFAVWQRERLRDGGGLEGQLDFWRRHLADAPDLLPLPTDRPRPAVQTPWGERRRLALSAGQSNGLRALARRGEATLFIALLAAFKALLVRLSHQEKLIVGTPAAYRQGPELQNVLGFFLNQIVLYTDLTGDPPFREVLARVRDTALAAYAHQDVPFARLVEDLRPERDLSRTPFTQVVLLLLDPAQQMRQGASTPAGPAAAGEIPAGQVEIEPYWVDAQRTQFDITFSLWEDAGLEGWLEYKVDLFDAATIDRWKEHFRTLLAGALEEPERRLWELPLLPAAQRQQLLHEWSGQAAAPSPASDTAGGMDDLLHGLFAAHAAAMPEAPALVWDGGQLTYGELAERAARLAGHLAGLGVGADRLAALLLPRGADWVVALLGTLQAGGAYLPLDEAIPSERLEAVLADARPRVVVTTPELQGLAAGATARLGGDGPEIVVLENGTDGGDSRGGPAAAVDPDNLAYVIYTSGSTGRPNGVLIRHRSIVHLMRVTRERCGVGPGSRLLQLASPSFDASVLETWLALASGACLVIPPSEARSGPALAEVIRREEISWLFLTPAVLAGLPDEGLPSLRSLAVGGESCPAEVATRWSAGRTLLNLYGPTEVTIYATLHRCAGNYRREPPIGRPVPGARVYVLDPQAGLAPQGVAGELCVAGSGLARGYLGRPDLAAARFSPDPFGGEAGARIYHTGDLARFRADGELEFLGRVDRQVKVRGFRIELGEIEAVLAAHPAVREAVVLARPPRRTAGASAPRGTSRLVAYVVPEPGTEASSVDDLRDALRRRLPEYMVPAAWVLLPALPLTASGKVDRRALPEPEATGTELTEPAPPSNAVEAALARVVAEVLGLPRVGVRDNFFALGGDSILSIQVITRARSLGIALTPTQLFQQQTVAELAAVANTLPALAAEIGPSSGPVPLTPVQRWFFSAIQDREPHHFNLSLLLATPHRLDPAPLAAALALLTRRHDALRLRFRRGPAGWDQWAEEPVAAPPGLLAVDLSALPPDVVPGILAAAVAEAQGSLDVTRGPLQRAVVFDLGEEQEGRLLWAVHHLLVDAVSWRVLIEDLTAAYGLLAHAQQVDLPPRTTSFKRWAELLAEHADSSALAAELPFWNGLPWGDVAPLPRDASADVSLGATASERTVSFELDEAETRALLEEVPQAYGTRIQEVLLTAVTRAFAAWTASPVLLVDLEGHGREEISLPADLSRTVGWLTSVYPVVLDLRGVEDPRPETALKAVKEQLRRIPGGGLGHGLLREALPQLPRAEVGFNYLGRLDRSPAAEPGGRATGKSEAAETGFRLAPEGSGPQRDPRLPRFHLLEIEGSIAGGRLALSCAYSSDIHRPATAERLMAGVAGALRELIAHCRQPEAGGYTPSDFPAARLGQPQLDFLAAHLGAPHGEPLRESLDDLYELSPMQQIMLAETLRHPGSGVYCVQFHGRLSGTLDRAALVRSWAEVIDRHPVLRTAFHWREPDTPLQTVWRRVEIPWEEDDWRTLPAAQQAERLEGFLTADRRRGFAPDAAPLLRLALFRVGDDAWRFVFTVHHLLLDGWCVALVFAEVLALYATYHPAGKSGEAPPLGRPRPYRDFILWLQRQETGEAERFWRHELAGFHAPTPLPYDRGRRGEDEETVASAQHDRELPAALTAALEGLARRHRLTLNTLVQGAWALLLARSAGRSDILFGTTVAGRPPDLPGSEAMIGLFINALPLRVEVTPEAPLIDWLRRLQERQVAVRQREHTPLPAISGWSELPGAPLFESLLAFENYPRTASDIGSGTVSGAGSSPGGAGLRLDELETVDFNHHPLTLVAVPGERLLLRLAYASERFTAAGAARTLRDLEALLAALHRALHAAEESGGTEEPSLGDLLHRPLEDSADGSLPEPREDRP